MNPIPALFLCCSAFAAATPWEQHFSAGETLNRAGNYNQSLHEFQLALKEAETAGPHDPALVTTLTNTAVLLTRVGQYYQAGRLYRRAIAIYKSDLPELKDGLATTLHDYAALNVREQHWTEAENLYRRSYELRNPDDLSAAATLNALGELAQERRRYREAEIYYLQAFAIYGKSKAASTLDMANLQHNLAMLYIETNRAAESENLFTTALATYNAEAPHDPRLAIILRNYAEFLARQKQYPQAEQSFLRALAVAQTSDEGNLLQAYAHFLQQRKRAAEANRILDRVPRAINGFNQTVDWRDLHLQN